MTPPVWTKTNLLRSSDFPAETLDLAIKGPIWFCGCIEDEGHFTVYGPFLNREDAVQEGNTGCDFAHLVAGRVGDNVEVNRSDRGTPTQVQAQIAWHVLRREGREVSGTAPTVQRAGATGDPS